MTARLWAIVAGWVALGLFSVPGLCAWWLIRHRYAGRHRIRCGDVGEGAGVLLGLVVAFGALGALIWLSVPWWVLLLYAAACLAAVVISERGRCPR